LGADVGGEYSDLIFEEKEIEDQTHAIQEWLDSKQNVTVKEISDKQAAVQKNLGPYYQEGTINRAQNIQVSNIYRNFINLSKRQLQDFLAVYL
jgi:uncharacterized protein (DUF2164 family)